MKAPLPVLAIARQTPLKYSGVRYFPSVYCRMSAVMSKEKIYLPELDMLPVYCRTFAVSSKEEICVAELDLQPVSNAIRRQMETVRKGRYGIFMFFSCKKRTLVKCFLFIRIGSMLWFVRQ